MLKEKPRGSVKLLDTKVGLKKKKKKKKSGLQFLLVQKLRSPVLISGMLSELNEYSKITPELAS